MAASSPSRRAVTSPHRGTGIPTSSTYTSPTRIEAPISGGRAFYINTADHDVQYYTGEGPEAGQTNWGASWPLIDAATLYEKDNVEFANERYAWYDEWLQSIDVE